MKLPNLITKHNTYLCITRDYVDPKYLQGNFKYKQKSQFKLKKRIQIFKPPKFRFKNLPRFKCSIQKRNSRIIQIGHAVEWKTFLTLTFSPEFYWSDLKLIQKQFRAYIKSLYYFIGEFKYLAVLEYGGQTGRIHYHMLTDIKYDNEIFEFRDHPFKKICLIWNYGFSDVSKVNNENCNAVFYLSKYLTKNQHNRTPVGKREVFSSNGLNKKLRDIVYGNITAIVGYREYAKCGKTTIYIKNPIV